MLCYLLWKFLVTSRGQIKLEECKDIDDFVNRDFIQKTEASSVDAKLSVATNNNENKIQHVNNIRATEAFETVQTAQETSTRDDEKSFIETDYSDDKNIFSLPNKSVSKIQIRDVIIERFALKETSIIKKTVKRESPPKERFAEFLEKTFNDDKIQSIIQNLSLDNADFFKCDSHKSEYDKDNTDLNRELKPLIIESKNTISEKAVKLQQSIDEIADKIKLLSNVSIVRDKEFENEVVPTNNVCSKENLLPSTIKALSKQAEEAPNEIKTSEDKTFLKRIQKQSGLPSGLNFGSVIGELKSKTRNSNGLKPVFKKFDIDVLRDTVDSAQVNNYIIIAFNKICHGQNFHMP